MSRIRVLLADDLESILEQIGTVLGADFEIVGAVSNGEDAVVEAERLDPDVLVIDISMPVLDGLHAAAQLRASNQHTKIVFLAGASGYVIKSDLTTDLVPAIREALRGHIYISQSIAKQH